jgi:hypothetical protein
MDFSHPVTQQYLFACFAIVFGLCGWLLPDKYNILKMKRAYAKHISESQNLKLARLIGALFILFGVAIATGTMLIGDLELF